MQQACQGFQPSNGAHWLLLGDGAGRAARPTAGHTLRRLHYAGS